MDATKTWLRERIREKDARIVTLSHENATLRGRIVSLEAERDTLLRENKGLRELHGVEAFEPSRYPAGWGGA